MKKIILTLLLTIVPLLSGEIEIAAKIVDRISTSLVQKDKVSIYTNDIRSLYITKISKNLDSTKLCNEADIIFTKTKDIPKCDNEKVLVFATTYLAFKSLPEAVGAFFYQKGRPSIIFREENLKKHNIVLAKEFDKYIE